MWKGLKLTLQASKTSAVPSFLMWQLDWNPQLSTISPYKLQTEPMAWRLFQSGIPKSAISQETSFYLDVKQCLTSKSCHEYVHKHLVSEGFTYLYFNSSHWTNHSPTRIMPLISQIEKAHCTRSKRSKNASGKGGCTSLGGTLSWTTEIVTVVKMKQKSA